MNRPQLAGSKQDSHIPVPADALDRLLDSFWEWAFEDYLMTPAIDREDHIFNTIVRLDSTLHGITVEESWVRIEAWRNQQHERNPRS